MVLVGVRLGERHPKVVGVVCLLPPSGMHVPPGVEMTTWWASAVVYIDHLELHLVSRAKVRGLENALLILA